MATSVSWVFLKTRVAVARVLVMATVIIAPQAEVAASPSRAFFVFGDSLVDSGNNNFLATSARCDFPPYGIDYPTHRPTGRFSDGLNLPDIISESMGTAPPLPYLNPDIMNGQNLLLGANFASAGIGILNDTGLQFLNVLRIHQQFELFQDYQMRLRNLLGQDHQAQQLVDHAVVLMTLGGNDFVNNYFLTPFAPRRRQFTLPQYCRYIIFEYKKILKRLYVLGARRVIVTGTGPLGCIPIELALYGSRNGECAPEPQRAAEIYNSMLFQMIQDLNNELGSDVFIASIAFDMNKDFISNPKQFGFETSTVACCGQGPYNGLGTCNIFSNLCTNRSAHVFWDAFHPGERAIRIIFQNMMTGSTKYMNPVNLSNILAMDSGT